MKKVDLTGMRIGRLTILRRSDKRLKRGKRTVPSWECVCDCGAVIYKATDSLTKKGMHMCGRCRELYAAEKARAKAGFVDGTQLAKLKEMTPTAANSSGVRGVQWDSGAGKWRARLRFKGKLMSFGCFDRFEDAVEARKAAEDIYFKAALAEQNNDS